MRFAVVVHPTRQIALDAVATLSEHAARHGIEVIEDPDMAAMGGIDILIAVGGDGTMLDAARRARPNGTPVIGVNAGTLGFLTEVVPSAVAELVDRLAAGDYTVVEHMTLRGVLPGGDTIDALNDIVTEKAVSERVVGLSLRVGGAAVADYRADGIIISSPTGSSAYSFSAGGPLVDPSLDAIVVTPVAAHDLFARPLVLAPDGLLEVTVTGDREAIVHADGQPHGPVRPGETVAVSRGPFRDRIIRFGTGGFAGTVRGAVGRRNAR